VANLDIKPSPKIISPSDGNKKCKAINIKKVQSHRSIDPEIATAKALAGDNAHRIGLRNSTVIVIRLTIGRSVVC
jgi:hypothetical protein